MPASPTIVLIGTVADLDNTVPNDPCHPALVVITDTAIGLVHIVVPAAAWPRARELLQVGRRLRATCEPTPGAPPVATRVELLDQLH